MMSIDIDAGAALKMGEHFARRAMEFAPRAHRILERAVADERAGHKFKNRSNAAENSIEVRGRATGGEIDVDIVFAVFYAVFLQRRGYSRFAERVNKALARIREQEVKRALGG